MTIKAIKSNQSICYSFSSRWFKSLTSGKVKVFFRKVRPIRVPELTFFYVGSPIKQIIGYAYIKKIEMYNHLHYIIKVKLILSVRPSPLSLLYSN